MKNPKTQSVEPNVADLANGWLKSYGLDYKLEQEPLNPQIDKALDEYHSKSGGTGGNRPDAKLLLRDVNLHDWPILIEYKGYKDRLAKFATDGQLANRTAKNEPDFKNINSYAVNGAVHYANALLHYTDYTDVIAIGVTGWRNEQGTLKHKIGVYLVAAAIIATLGIPGKVSTLDKSELKSSTEDGNRDGDIILRKIEAFLKENSLPVGKKDMIVRTLQNTLTTDNINKPVNGESQLKRVFTKIVDDLGIYYKTGLTTDFTGKLFNEMYSWLGFTQDKLNDVVLTPSYVATLLVRLARVDMDSFVWDFATGSAGLLVAALNVMLADAKAKIKSPDEFARKSAAIKASQLLGLEVLSNIYMLAILNMILMGGRLVEHT